VDTGRLRRAAELLRLEEKNLGIQGILNQLTDALGNLAGSPGNPDFQTQVANHQIELRNAIGQLTLARDPAFAAYGEALGAIPYFGPGMPIQIAQAITDNAMTPTVARDILSDLRDRRASYLEQLHQLVSAMTKLGIAGDEVVPGEAQIGFRIPRTIFDNEFAGWIAELNEIKRIVRPFAELATGGDAPIGLGEVSSSNPIVFLIATAPVIALISTAVSWSLDQWKKVEEIKKIRAETARLSADNSGALDDMIAQFDAKIATTIEAAIAAHATQLVNPGAGPGRDNELVNAVTYSLKSLMARIERGMTVELKFLPYEEAPDPESAQAMDQIASIVPQLVFSAPSPAPVLALPGNDNDPPPEA